LISAHRAKINAKVDIGTGWNKDVTPTLESLFARALGLRSGN
jgi:hypothetical protein